MDLTVPEDEPDDRSFMTQRAPLLRELLTLFHRVSTLPERLSSQEERLYVAEAIESLERMRSILTYTHAGQVKDGDEMKWRISTPGDNSNQLTCWRRTSP